MTAETKTILTFITIGAVTFVGLCAAYGLLSLLERIERRKK